jgi:hypothetical protein
VIANLGGPWRLQSQAFKRKPKPARQPDTARARSAALAQKQKPPSRGASQLFPRNVTTVLAAFERHGVSVVGDKVLRQPLRMAAR